MAIETCIKYPRGPTQMKFTDVLGHSGSVNIIDRGRVSSELEVMTSRRKEGGRAISFPVPWRY